MPSLFSTGISSPDGVLDGVYAEGENPSPRTGIFFEDSSSLSSEVVTFGDMLVENPGDGGKR